VSAEPSPPLIRSDLLACLTQTKRPMRPANSDRSSALLPSNQTGGRPGPRYRLRRDPTTRPRRPAWLHSWPGAGPRVTSAFALAPAERGLVLRRPSTTSRPGGASRRRASGRALETCAFISERARTRALVARPDQTTCRSSGPRATDGPRPIAKRERDGRSLTTTNSWLIEPTSAAPIGMGGRTSTSRSLLLVVKGQSALARIQLATAPPSATKGK
jgi:hypothetical protein